MPALRDKPVWSERPLLCRLALHRALDDNTYHRTCARCGYRWKLCQH